MIRQGINEKNHKYWKERVFMEWHKLDEQTADIKASLICQGQEIERLRARIIKLEKRNNKGGSQKIV
jgi:hypothetical protein